MNLQLRLPSVVLKRVLGRTEATDGIRLGSSEISDCGDSVELETSSAVDADLLVTSASEAVTNAKNNTKLYLTEFDLRSFRKFIFTQLRDRTTTFEQTELSINSMICIKFSSLTD